jgi:hypothetical protein
MPDIPKTGGYKHKALLADIRIKEADIQDLVDQILVEVASGKTEFTTTQLSRVGIIRGLLAEIKDLATDGIDLISNAEQAEEKKILLYERKKVAGDD